MEGNAALCRRGINIHPDFIALHKCLPRNAMEKEK